MMACIGRNLSPLFKFIKCKILVFDDVCIFYFILINLVFLKFLNIKTVLL